MSESASSDLLRRRPPPPIPILVLTGFLGAGKTTLLNGWVRSATFADAAVVINEFGEIGIDHLLVEQAVGTMLTLSSGCLCCTVRGDLITTLEDLIRRRDNGRIPPFNRLVIETTGLADPAPILNTIMFHPYLPMRYRLDSVVTVVDALHGLATIADRDEALKQVAVADTLVLTKTDLALDGTDRSALTTRLAELNPAARILDAAAGGATVSAILDDGLFDLDKRQDQVRTWLNPETYAAESPHDHDHHDNDGHHHDANRHDDHIRAFCLTSEAPLDPTAFQMFIDLVRGTHGAKLLRVKGIVALADDPAHPLVIHGVQHYFHPPHRLGGWPDADHRSRLVFIVRDLDSMVLQKLWSGFFGGPAIDQPDAAALAEVHQTAGGLFG
jgi:G3E family GTPase